MLNTAVTEQLVVDADVKSVLAFMQAHIPTARLVGVSELLPQMARLLWSDYPQEPLQVMRLEADPIRHEQLSVAI